jgi:hypothetical protein
VQAVSSAPLAAAMSAAVVHGAGPPVTACPAAASAARSAAEPARWRATAAAPTSTAAIPTTASTPDSASIQTVAEPRS